MILGITGSIGSGKTTVAKIFSKYNYARIDADEISHNLIESNQIRNKIIKTFSNAILDNNRKISRKKLGSIVFNDNGKLRKLNSIMHPAIINEIKNQIRKIQKKCGNDAKIIVDAPLLLETGAKKLVKKIIVVNSSPEKIVYRNKRFSKKQIERILKSQMPLKEKLKHAHFTVENNGNLKSLDRHVKKIIGKLK